MLSRKSAGILPGSWCVLRTKGLCVRHSRRSLGTFLLAPPSRKSRERAPPVLSLKPCRCASQINLGAVETRYNSWLARLRSDAFFVRNVARHGAGSHRHQLSAVHQHLLCSR